MLIFINISFYLHIKLVRLSKENPIKQKIKTYFGACSNWQKIAEGLGVTATPETLSRFEALVFASHIIL